MYSRCLICGLSFDESVVVGLFVVRMLNLRVVERLVRNSIRDEYFMAIYNDTARGKDVLAGRMSDDTSNRRDFHLRRFRRFVLALSIGSCRLRLYACLCRIAVGVVCLAGVLVALRCRILWHGFRPTTSLPVVVMAAPFRLIRERR